MQRIAYFILGICFLSADATSHRRQKRDTRTVINDALNLFYYGQNFKMPSIKLNTQASTVCSASGYGGYWLHDIIGQADNVAVVDDCLAGCMNIPDCVAVNYIENLRQCVALRCAATDPNNLLFDNDLRQAYHYYFKDCKGKTPKPATKPAQTPKPESSVAQKPSHTHIHDRIGRVQYDLGNGMVSNCGSSLVMSGSATESDIVITAAHCVVNSDKSDRDPNRFTLIFGNHDNLFLEAQEQRIGVKKVVYNADYKTKGTADIAIFKLKTPIKFNNYIRPICMANAGQLPKDKNSCVAAGWGRLSNSNSNTPERLQQVRYPVQDDKVCSANNVWGGTFDPATMTCAGPLDGSVSTCQGDSGGPLACFEDGHRTLYGATSFGNGQMVNNLAQCAASNKPAVFARISGLRAWIDKTMTDLKKF